MLRIRADIRANVRLDEALMASMGSSGLPFSHPSRYSNDFSSATEDGRPQGV